ncbi:TPA: hypothetical protein L3K28_004788 [Escherichia coli]|nr:hypothetical protein [Escherichia coli]
MKHQGKTEKCVRIVFRGLHNYAQKRFMAGFTRFEQRTGQNSKLSHPEKGELVRNLFELRETLSTNIVSRFIGMYGFH